MPERTTPAGSQVFLGESGCGVGHEDELGFEATARQGTAVEQMTGREEVDRSQVLEGRIDRQGKKSKRSKRSGQLVSHRNLQIEDR